jgi:hypothetical protein
MVKRTLCRHPDRILKKQVLRKIDRPSFDNGGFVHTKV